MKVYISLLWIAVLLFSCSSKERNEQEVTKIINNVIPFEYGGENTKHILFDSFINDSILVKIFFDTGVVDTKILISDSLKNRLDTTAFLRIGNLGKLVDLWFMDKDYPFFEIFGSNAVLVGWRFFEDTIIEISYHDKCLKILPELPESLDDYKSIKLYKNDLGFLLVPMIAYIQGKQIKKGVLIDTGSDGSLALSFKDAVKNQLNMDSARVQTSYGITDSIKSYSLKTDSIAILLDRNTEITGYTIANGINASFVDVDRNVAMLGNSFLENFELILDLKDYYLYLKPRK
ncbi:hypothetical protein LJB91_00140 [Bacteroidales bacterium OttesenSCG-928-L03]|nr:hypothetical protein [Bacteroidales bacterium OttesenSCG-928-L03]